MSNLNTVISPAISKDTCTEIKQNKIKFYFWSQVIAPTSPVSSKATSARQTTAVLPPEGASHKTPESTPKKTQALSNIGTDQMSLGDGESIEVCPECQKVFKRKVTVYFWFA